MEIPNRNRIYQFLSIIILISLAFGLCLPTPMKVRANPGIIYVRSSATGANDGTSWEDAYTDLQDALAFAISGDEIWVAAGTYKPSSTGDRYATFQLLTDVALYGGFPAEGGTWESRDWEINETILSGDIGVMDDVSDNSYHVISIYSLESTPVLNGFTIRDGNASGSSPHDSGGGVYILKSKLIIKNTKIRNNFADYEGGGVFAEQSNSIFENVRISNNSSGIGGGMHNFSSNPEIINASFIDNSASDGGGMHNRESSPRLEEVTFLGNTASDQGGGLYNQTLSSPILKKVTFINNSASSGGAIYNIWDSNPLIINAVVKGNSAESLGGGIFNKSGSNPIINGAVFYGNSALNYGGGIYNYDVSDTALTNVTFSSNTAGVCGGGMSNEVSVPKMTNVTFYNNTAGETGGALYNTDESNAVITNSILWGNSPNQIYNFVSAPTITYSDIQGGYVGTGNINQDPLLGDLADNGGFTETHALMIGSPAIDSGDLENCPITDQRGVYRPQSAGCDMGAYEYDLGRPSFTSTPITEVTQDELYNYEITAEDPYPEETLAITALTKPDWLTLSDNGDGTALLTGTPSNDDVGDHQLQILVTSSQNLSDIQIFTIKVINVNEQPTFISIPHTRVIQGDGYGYGIAVEDPDFEESLEILAIIKPEWLNFEFYGGNWAELNGHTEGVPLGDYDVELLVRDSVGLEATQAFTISVVESNEGPTFTSTPITEATQDNFYIYNITASDPDEGDSLIFLTHQKPDWLTLTDFGDGTALLTGTPSEADIGECYVQLIARDGVGWDEWQNFSITVVEKLTNFIYLPLIISDSP